MREAHVESSTEYYDGYKIGQAIGAASNGISMADILKKASFVETCENDVDMQRLIAETGAYIFEKAGMTNCFEYKAMEKIASVTAPVTGYTAGVFLSPVLQSLSYFRKAADAAADEIGLQKEAAPGLAFTAIPSVVGKTVGSMPAAVKLLAMLGIGGGLAGGGLTWALNRAAKQDDADVAAKEEQAAHYRRIAEDIAKRIKLERDKDNRTKAIEEESGAYVV